MWLLYPLALCLLVVFYPPELLLLGSLGIMALPLVLLFPEYVTLLMVVLISSIVFEDDLPLIPLKGLGSLHITDVMLLILMAKMLFNHFTHQSGTVLKTPLSIPLILFFSMVTFSACTSIFRSGQDPNVVIREVRGMSYYLLFLVMVSVITTAKQIHVVTKGLLAIGTLVALAMIAQAVAGESLLLVPGRVEAAGTFGSDYGVLRILPPGQTLVYVLFVMVLCRIVLMPKRSLLNFLLLAVLGGGVALTYNRVYWVSIMIALIALSLISKRVERKRLVCLVAMMVAILTVTLTAFTIMGGKYAESAASITERFTSIFAGDQLTESSSLVDRSMENEYAVKTISRNPLIGSGLHTVYRPNIYGDLDTLNYYVHNAYLWFIKDIGIFGLIFFMWFFGGFIARGLLNFNHIVDESLRSIVAGFTLSAFGMIPMSVVNPVYMQWYSILCIAIASGVTEAIIAINGVHSRNKVTEPLLV